MSESLDRYKGLLDTTKLADGMTACSHNAKRLAEDARILLRSGRYPSAAALAALAIEEAGKISILRSLALARSEAEAKQEWRRFRSHTSKNVQWLFPSLVSKGARHLDEFASLFDQSADHPAVLDQVKQISIYVDCYGDAHWSAPTEVIGEDLATSFVTIAELLSNSRAYTAEELDLWVHHLAPVWKRSGTWTRRALVNWHEDMKKRGTIPKDAPDMESFVFPPAPPPNGEPKGGSDGA